MKLQEAKNIIRKAAGYRVHFEKRERGLLCSDYFPDRDEPTIAELPDAWMLAEQFAAANPGLYVNVYVVNAHDHTPVDGYKARELNVHPPVPDVCELPPSLAR